jgi:hypothetical protein
VTAVIRQALAATADALRHGLFLDCGGDGWLVIKPGELIVPWSVLRYVAVDSRDQIR